MNIETFKNKELGNVRVYMKGEEVWFVAADVCKRIGISNGRDAVSRLDSDEKDMSVLPTRSGNKNLTVVNESGLYSLIMTSRKPEAKKFKKWVTSEVLPSIRKTGSYSVNLSPAEILLKQAQMLVDVERKQKILEENQKVLESRMNTFDNLELENDRQKLNAMVRKYATLKGIAFNQGWKVFRQKYNGAYQANITALQNNFKKANELKRLTLPDFLERTGRLQDSLRVADKMLNGGD